MFKIKNPNLLKLFPAGQNSFFNGLQKFSCESCIYTNNNTFYVQAPAFAREENSEYWDIGFLDVKNTLFYELGILMKNRFEKNLFFDEWITFLQIIIDRKIYSKLLEFFGFDKGHLSPTDRTLYEPQFFKHFKSVIYNNFGTDFTIYLCDLFKNQNKMVSYCLLKKKLKANLKNFRDSLKMTFSGSIK